MAALSDVARQAGVSTSTASRALTRPEMVRREVVDRVRRVAGELGYSANPFARSLRLRTSKTLGLIVPDSTNPFFAEVARGIEAACFRAGYTLILCNSDRSLEKEAAQARVLAEKRADGVLLFSAADASAGTVEWLQARGVPVVLVERRPAGFGVPVDCVVSDNRGGVRQAVAHLHAQGYRRLACLAGPLGSSHYAERVAAFREALAELGLPAPERLVQTELLTFADGQRVAEDLLGGPHPPDALLCATDTLAIGALRGVAVAGREVPREVGVVGFGNTEITAYTTPPLTSVGQQRLAVGARAVRVLLRRLAPGTPNSPGTPGRGRGAGPRAGWPGGGEGARAYVVPTRLEVRQSSSRSAPRPGQVD
jgi:LacI family transcriptional regulator